MVKPFASPRRAYRAPVVGWVLLLLVGMPGWSQAQDVQFGDITTNDREVSLNWAPVPGDTLTQAERLDVPFLRYDVPDALGVKPSEYGAADPVVGQGAGRYSSKQYQIYVGYEGDFHQQSEPPSPPPVVPFDVAGAFQFGPSQVAVAFTGAVNPAQLGTYTFVPSLTVVDASLQANGSTVILQVSGTLPPLTSFTGDVTGVTSSGGSPPTGDGSFAFQTASGTVTPIASIQANPSGFVDSVVTVVGQVYIPTGTAPNAAQGLASGYIQDGSNRGINLWGGTIQSDVNDVGNVVSVTGTVAMAGTTVQLTAYTPTLLASGIPRLGAQVVTLPDALSPRWEGTFIQVQGLISRIDTEMGSLYMFYATALDTAFGGYQVWRAQTANPDPDEFLLLRTYALVDSTWTFVGTDRAFSDPDSIILRGADRVPDETRVAGPFNGFQYTYAVTWFNTEINATTFPNRYTNFPQTFPSNPASQVVVVPNQPAVESTPLLGNVLVVPNPYNPDAAFGQGTFPTGPGVQFVNLPASASISVYTVSGDLVQTLEKPNDPGSDAVFWDLTNGDGKPISAGIYFYYVTAEGEEKIGKFVIIR